MLLKRILLISLQHDNRRNPPKPFQFNTRQNSNPSPNQPQPAVSPPYSGKSQNQSKWPPRQYSKIQCQICHKISHFASICYQCPNLNFQPSSHQIQANITTVEPSNFFSSRNLCCTCQCSLRSTF